MVTELQIYGITEGQVKSNIAPLFQSGAIIISFGTGHTNNGFSMGNKVMM